MHETVFIYFLVAFLSKNIYSYDNLVFLKIFIKLFGMGKFYF